MDHLGRIHQEKGRDEQHASRPAIGMHARSIRNAGLTLRAKEQRVDDMIVFKDEKDAKPVNEDFGKPWLELKLREWCDGR